jgi:hypothetical protein
VATAVLVLFPVALATWQAILTRDDSNPDGISYLDVARSYAGLHLGQALNSYWSPLYSWGLAVVLALTRVSSLHDAAMAHGLNLVIYAVATGCFWLFLRELSRVHVSALRRSNAELDFDRVPLLVMGTGVFLWGTFGLIVSGGLLVLRGPGLITPDLLVVAVVLAASTVALRLRSSAKVGWWVVLGALLGVGYLTKTAMLVASPGFLVGAAIAAGLTRQTILRACAAAAITVLVAAPFAIAITAKTGHPTFGTSGSLNWEWSFSPSDLPQSSSEAPWLSHPATLLTGHPSTYRFTPNQAGQTFPIFNDPAYWNAGTPLRWSFGRQAQIVWASLRSYADALTIFGLAFTLAVGVFLVSGIDARRDLRATLALAIGPTMMLAIYAPIEKAESRFVAGGLIVLVTALAALSTRPHALSYTVATAVLVLGVFAVAHPLAGSTAREQSRLFWMNANQLHLAQALKTLGVCQGSNVAVIGNPYSAYWAHADNLHITASTKISQAGRFWGLSHEAQRRALAALTNDGRQAVVADPPPTNADSAGWERIAGTGFLLRRPASRRIGVHTCNT